MSLAATRWAMQVQSVGLVPKMVLLVLADHADDDGRCWPSVARLAALGCMSERAARNGLRDLERAGLVQSDARSGANTRYALAVETPAPAAPTPAASAPLPRQDVPPTPAPAAPHPGTTCPLTYQVTKKEKEEVAPPSASPAAKPDPRGTRLSSGWQPSPDDAAYASGRGLDPAAVAENFRDFWHGKAGKDGRKCDWPATWRTWCRKDAERAPPARAGPDQRSDEAVLRAAGLWPPAREEALQPLLMG